MRQGTHYITCLISRLYIVDAIGKKLCLVCRDDGVSVLEATDKTADKTGQEMSGRGRSHVV